MEQRLISVVIPTYNCAVKLAATIESVLSQPRELYELIVVDGGSTDETLEVVGKYDGQLTLVSEKDCGIYDAFNKGIRMSSGEYLYFLGAGDRVRRGAFAKVAESLPKSRTAFAYSDVYLARFDVRYDGEFRKADLTRRNICQQAIFYARGIFELLGEFDLNYKLYADWAMNMKCLGDSRVLKVYVDLVVADFEEGGRSETHADDNFTHDFMRLIRRYLGVREYLKHGIYLTRVSFYDFRHGAADFICKVAAHSLSMFKRRSSYNAEKKADVAP